MLFSSECIFFCQNEVSAFVNMSENYLIFLLELNCSILKGLLLREYQPEIKKHKVSQSLWCLSFLRSSSILLCTCYLNQQEHTIFWFHKFKGKFKFWSKRHSVLNFHLSCRYLYLSCDRLILEYSVLLRLTVNTHVCSHFKYDEVDLQMSDGWCLMWSH